MSDSDPVSPVIDPVSVDPAVVRDRRIVLGLVLLTLLCYWPLGTAGFVNYDDPAYITENTHVQQGLSTQSLKYAFTSYETGYWHPLAWITHLIDVNLYGPVLGGQSLIGSLLHADNALPAGHHFTSLLFHLGNALLLWHVLRRYTGAVWPSAWVAAMFAVHPMHVESVAWISERKDVVCTLFILLTFLAYHRYALARSAGRYALVALALAAALLSKPMAVTVPCLLVLMDLWPLRIVPFGPGFGRLLVRSIAEKLPLLAMSAAVAVVTFKATAATLTNLTLAQVPLSQRLQTAVIGYGRYLQKFVRPTDLSPFYPIPPAWPTAGLIASIAVVLAFTVLALWQARRRPYLIVGWLWFIGMLVPVIGLIAVSDSAMSDRYSYLAYTGLLFGAAWLAMELLARHRPVLIGLAAVSILACVPPTIRQVTYWQNSLALMGHSLAVTNDNWLANIDYGAALTSVGREDEAGPYYKEAVRIRPNGFSPNLNYGRYLLDEKQIDLATPHILLADKIKPGDPTVLTLVARVKAMFDRHAEAVEMFEHVLKQTPDSFEAETYLAESLIRLGRVDEAEAHLRHAVLLRPNVAGTYYRLGQIAATRGNAGQAVEAFKKALDLDPGLGVAHLDYGITLARMNQYAEAMQELDLAGTTLGAAAFQDKSKAELTTGQVLERMNRPLDAARHYLAATAAAHQAVDAAPNDPSAHYQLAMTLKQTDQPDAAIVAAQRAMDVAVRHGNVYFVNELHRQFTAAQLPSPATVPATLPATQP